LDGLELLPYEENTLGIIPTDMIVGVHLSYYSSWVDFWNGNEAGVLDEFGSWETARRTLGTDRWALVDRYKAQLEFAENLGAEYVVFHVADVSIAESIRYVFSHTDAEVITAALELINAILDGGQYSFHFLVENLWWPGFSMTVPNMTRRLIEGIHCEKKGIMLDTGHLLHTNNALTTEKEGLEYIHSLLDAHGDLCSYIKGIHLQQGLTGAYVRALLDNPPKLAGSYDARLGQIYPHIHAIDPHRPFTDPNVAQLVERLQPEFLTHEFGTRSRFEHEDFMTCQNAALKAINIIDKNEKH
jgi:hypothetical protein